MIKIGIIGLGKWGKNHLKSLSKIKCEIIAISDTDETKKVIAKNYGINYYKNYNDLLNQVDAVIVSTPTDKHYEIAMDCLKSNKHVLVEKPITTNSEQSKKLVDFAEKNNLILSVGYLFRFNSSIKKIKELMKKIGEIQYITIRYIHSTKPPREDSGAIINLGIHPIDILNYITDKRPSTVFSKKKNLISEKYEDSAIILLDYIDFFATIEVSCTHPEKKRDMWIIAEKEKIYVDFFNQKVIRYPIIIKNNKIEKKESINEIIDINEPLKDELQYFINLVDGKNKNELTETENIGEEEYYTTKVCELSIKSAETGKEMKIE